MIVSPADAAATAEEIVSYGEVAPVGSTTRVAARTGAGAHKIDKTTRRRAVDMVTSVAIIAALSGSVSRSDGLRQYASPLVRTPHAPYSSGATQVQSEHRGFMSSLRAARADVDTAAADRYPQRPGAE